MGLTSLGMSAGTAATVSSIASIAGTGLSFLSSIQQGQSQKAAYNYEAKVNASNARNSAQKCIAGSSGWGTESGC